ncbi:unnamed protein product, partial [marine sediment metagenome]
QSGQDVKILHVAVFRSRSTNVWQAAGFESLGHTVIRYDYRALGRKYGRVRRDDHLIAVCRKERPDIILFSKCNLMDVRVVKECNKVGTTVLWYMDDPKPSCPNWDVELINKMKHCSYVFCSVKKCVEDAKEYCENTYRLQGGFDSAVHYPMSFPKKRNVTFIGTLRPEKRVFLEGWNFDTVIDVYGKDHSRIVSETRINLSFTHGGGTSNRLYKLLAAKGFVLTQPWEGMGEDFESGRDFVVFFTPQDLERKIRYYLAHQAERERIAAHGYETVKKYDNINYAKKILEAIA